MLMLEHSRLALIFPPYLFTERKAILFYLTVELRQGPYLLLHQQRVSQCGKQ